MEYNKTASITSESEVVKTHSIFVGVLVYLFGMLWVAKPLTDIQG